MSSLIVLAQIHPGRAAATACDAVQSCLDGVSSTVHAGREVGVRPGSSRATLCAIYVAQTHLRSYQSGDHGDCPVVYLRRTVVPWKEETLTVRILFCVDFRCQLLNAGE